jgi:hypothetical protein
MKEFVEEIKCDLKLEIRSVFLVLDCLIFLPSSVSICGSTSNHDEEMVRALQRPT